MIDEDVGSVPNGSDEWEVILCEVGRGNGNEIGSDVGESFERWWMGWD